MKNTDVAEPGRHYWLVRTTPISTRDGGGAHSTHFTSGPGRADPPVDPVLKEGETFHGAWECFQVITSGHQAAACWRRLVGPPLALANQPEPEGEPGQVLELVPSGLDPETIEKVLAWFYWHAFSKGVPVALPRVSLQEALRPFATKLPHEAGTPLLNHELLAVELAGSLLEGVEELNQVRAIDAQLPHRVFELRVGLSHQQEGLILMAANQGLGTRAEIGLSPFDARNLAHALLGAVASLRRAEFERHRLRDQPLVPPYNPNLAKVSGMFDTKARAAEAVAALGTPRVPDGTPDVPEEPKKPGTCTRAGICPLVAIGEDKIGCSRCDAMAVRGSSWFAEAEPYLHHHRLPNGEE